jgi:hypothetical protein
LYVLRKSFGAWSAGTPLYVKDGFFEVGGEVVPLDLVTQRRERTTVEPVINSRARRKQNKEARQLVESLKGN